MSEKSRLAWRCRRGIREMDIVLQDFLDHFYGKLPEFDQQLFNKLLEQPDLNILDWLMGRSEPDTEELRRIVSIIRKSRDIQHTVTGDK